MTHIAPCLAPRFPRRFLLAPVFALLAAVPAYAAVANPTVEGPITGPGVPFVAATTFDLAEVGYVQEEYFLTGTASAYTTNTPLGLDGKWTVTPGDTAAYKTRIVVHRPLNTKAFNGTVVFEWLNVSGGLDSAPDWILAHTEFTREGWVWVGVSAQEDGIEVGVPLLPGLPSLPLKTANPNRYASLAHPGDSFSYDIFSQAAQAILHPAGTNPLAGYTVKRAIAAGESQSAFRMVNYCNAIHALTDLFDGYFIHSRGGFDTPLSEAPQASIVPPGRAEVRSDIDVPVLTLQTETDLTFLQYFGARQDDSKSFRLWEVAGTAHADTYTVEVGQTDRGNDPDVVAPYITSTPLGGIFTCPSALNTGPHHFVVKAAFAALERWIKTGKAPKPAPRLETSGSSGTFVRDEHGNVRGGIRTPQVDVPLVTLLDQQVGPIICMLFGTTIPFDDAKIAQLYPTRRAFVSAYNRATKRALRRGHLRPADAKLIRQWAASANIGGS